MSQQFVPEASLGQVFWHSLSLVQPTLHVSTGAASFGVVAEGFGAASVAVAVGAASAGPSSTGTSEPAHAKSIPPDTNSVQMATRAAGETLREPGVRVRDDMRLQMEYSRICPSTTFEPEKSEA